MISWKCSPFAITASTFIFFNISIFQKFHSHFFYFWCSCQASYIKILSNFFIDFCYFNIFIYFNIHFFPLFYISFFKCFSCDCQLKIYTIFQSIIKKDVSSSLDNSYFLLSTSFLNFLSMFGIAKNNILKNYFFTSSFI